MKSFSKIMLVVLSVVGMTAGLTTIAQGDTLWGGYDGAGVNVFDMAGTKLTPPSFTFNDEEAQGLALSPDGAILYVASHDDGVIRTHNATTGAVINAGFADIGSLGYGRPGGIATDSSGNIYVGTAEADSGATGGYVHKIAPDGTITARWGGRLGSSNQFGDVEIVGDYLYAAVNTGNTGVMKYDLAAGGNPTQAVSTTRTDGIASGPDGSWYTIGATEKRVYKWTSTWENKTEIGNIGNYCFDVDYWDGALYVSAYSSGIKKYDLTAETWSTFVNDGKNYRYTVVIPEPGTLALLATGLIGLLCYAWRKRK